MHRFQEQRKASFTRRHADYELGSLLASRGRLGLPVMSAHPGVVVSFRQRHCRANIRDAT
jgi:hypothetical protein